MMKFYDKCDTIFSLFLVLIWDFNFIVFCLYVDITDIVYTVYMNMM